MSQVTLVQQSHGEGQLQGLLQQQQQQRIEAVRQRSRNNNHLLVQVGQHLLDGGFWGKFEGSDSGYTVDVGCMRYSCVVRCQMSHRIFIYRLVQACATPPGKMSKTAGEAVAVWSLFLVFNLMQLDGPMRFSSSG